MDIQRYLLIAVIAVLSFMLMTEYVHFSQRPTTAPVAAASAQSPELSVPQPSASDGPAAVANVAAPASVDAPDANATSRYVHVRTDVLDIKIDRQGGDIVYAALPQHSEKLKTPDKPFVLLSPDTPRTYVAQSGLVGLDSNAARPLYQAANENYLLTDGTDTLTVALSVVTEQGLNVVKTFTFRRGDYLVDVDYRVKNNGTAPWQGTLYGQLKRDNSADPSVISGAFGIASFLGAAIHLPDSPYHKLPFDDMAESPLKQTVQGGWIAFVQHYFLTAWIPAAGQQNQFATRSADGMHLGWFTAPTQTVAPNAEGTFSARFYAGPKDQYRLRKVSPGLDLSVDYGWLWWIAQPLFYCLTKIHGWLGNWGWSIVVLTIGVKALFFWLNAKAYTSMANMRRVQPKLLEIRERYADDKQKQSQEMMSLYKTEKINPLGGCLPVIVQMPVFLALYWVLLESVELRHAPWIGWIKDLSAMDPIFVLPLIMGATMYLQQKLNPPPPDPMQAKVMQFMPIMFTVFFLWFPAGLVLYYIVNNVLSIAQQYVITKRVVKDF